MEYADLEIGGQYYCWTNGECKTDDDGECSCSGSGWEQVELVGFVPVETLGGARIPGDVFCAVKKLSLGQSRGPMMLVCVSQMSETVGR